MLQYLIGKRTYQRAIADYCARLGGMVVDVGCGFKPLAPRIPARRYVGLDTDPQHDLDVLGDAMRLPFVDASFDSAVCTDVLEHVPEPTDVLEELHRVLRDGGQVLVSVPMSWGLHYEPHDYYRYTRYGLDYVLTGAGFEVLGTKRVGGIFSLVGSRLADVILMQAERRLGGLPARARLAIGLCGSLPIAVTFYGLGRLFDQIDDADAIGWIVLARKRPEAADGAVTPSDLVGVGRDRPDARAG